jgi:putative endonuclease
MEPFFYTYVIVSAEHPDRYYIGFMENLEDRLNRHNAGAVPSTAPYRPWRYRMFMGFADRQRALDSERYLKTHSGRAFLAKRL